MRDEVTEERAEQGEVGGLSPGATRRNPIETNPVADAGVRVHIGEKEEGEPASSLPISSIPQSTTRGRGRPQAARGHSISVPRAFRDHTSHRGREYGRYVRQIRDRHPHLPKHADLVLREAGLASVELEALAQDVETARAKGNPREARMVGKRQFALREQLMRLEKHLADLAREHAAKGVGYLEGLGSGAVPAKDGHRG